MIALEPIGQIHTPWTQLAGMPIQPAGARGVRGVVEVWPPYQAGLKDLEGFSHLFLIYHFHAVSGYELQVVPFLDRQMRGVFATRAPKRPNPIGLSLVRLLAVLPDGRLEVEDVDMLDGTPLLDIKPYVPEFDAAGGPVRIGWLAQVAHQAQTQPSDARFGA
jgi:tRNA-Thr(GGU) m(6)t(6)A37 methyltransferase TsaA